MTKIVLFFDSAVAKYFNYHCDSITGKPTAIAPELKKMVLLMAEPIDNPTAVKEIPGKQKIEANIPSTDNRYKHEYRFRTCHIPEPKMLQLNDALKRLIDHEINLAIEFHIDNGLEIKKAIEQVITKYDFDDCDGYSYDRIKKMNQRFRKRVNS